jgi:hypothetical protein
MLFTRLFLVILFFFSPFLTRGQKVYTIPFRLTEYNNLSVEAILNETDTVNLMFHTAANSVTLTEEAIKKLKSLRFTNNTDSIKSWGSQTNSSRLSIDNSISIGELKWKNVPVWENINSGQYTDGKFGIDLFKGRVIEIDFDNSIIHLSEGLPKKVNKYKKVKLISRDDNLFIEANCKTKDSSFKNKFLIHSGYSGAVLFDDQFAKDARLNDKLQVIGEKILTDSYGNILKAKQVILPGLIIQGFKLVDVPAGFFDGAIGRQKISILGGDILKRFNLVIDAGREYIYLKPGKWMKTGYRKM